MIARVPSVIGVVALLAAIVVTTACSGPRNGRLEDAEALGQADGLAGETVTVSGEVTDVFDGGAFLINGEDLSFGTPAGTLILGPEDSAVSVGGFARVSGTVERLVITDLEPTLRSRYGEDVLATYEDEYIVRAETVTAIDKPGAAAAALEKALDDPETEVLETLTLSARVRDVMAPQVFWIGGPRGEGVAVVTQLRPDIDAGDVVEITGTVRSFDPEVIQREAGITLRSDVADELRRRLREDVVFVADYVQLANTEG